MMCADDIGNLLACNDPNATVRYDDATGTLIPLVHASAGGSGGVSPALVFVICLSVLACALSIKLARHKGYGTAAGVIAGVCLPIIAVIFFALVPAKDGSAATRGAEKPRSAERAALEAEMVAPETTNHRRAQIESMLQVMA